jgi:hypothetical protein
VWKSINIEKFSKSLNHHIERLEDRLFIIRVEINQLIYKLIKDIKNVVEDSTL